MIIRKKNGFVFMETVVVVCVLSITLMLLYGSYAHILRTSREKQTFDTTDSIYTTYNVVNYISTLSLSGRTGLTEPVCKIIPQIVYRYIDYDRVVTVNPLICDLSLIKNDASHPLYPLAKMFDVDKIYLNLSPKDVLESPDKNDILMQLDATSIDYIQSLGVGETFVPSNETYIIVKYKHVYDDNKYEVVHSNLKQPLELPRYIYEGGYNGGVSK